MRFCVTSDLYDDFGKIVHGFEVAQSLSRDISIA